MFGITIINQLYIPVDTNQAIVTNTETNIAESNVGGLDTLPYLKYGG